MILNLHAARRSLACARLETAAVHHADAAAVISDEPGVLQLLRGDRYDRPAHGERVRDALLCDMEFLRTQAVVRH
jgi:hypothetical protein